MTVSEEDYDVNRLEERVRELRDRAGRELLVRALEALENTRWRIIPELCASGRWNGAWIRAWVLCALAAGA